VVIDDASIMGIDCSAIPENIYLIWWYPHSKEGEILYKHEDRMPIREPFTDFSPYVHLFDRFLIMAMNRVPPISLAQAKLVKSRMVDALSVSRMRIGLAMSHKNNIAALATVREVVEYDVMKGWSDADQRRRSTHSELAAPVAAGVVQGRAILRRPTRP
jgi:hypothetical protein